MPASIVYAPITDRILQIVAVSGINVNNLGPSGQSPLSYAMMRYQGFVKKLIRAQADPNKRP